MLGPWLTERQLCALFIEKGCAEVTRSKVSRWAQEGLLYFEKIREVRYYPPETFHQALAVYRLLSEKRKFEDVGWDLWWLGYWVDEKHWKPRLRTTAARLDRCLKVVRKFIASDEKASSRKTVFDRAAQSGYRGSILSRVYRLVSPKGLPTVFRIVLTTAAGKFEGYEPVTKTKWECAANSTRPYDEEQMIAALNFHQSETDAILGKKLRFAEALCQILRDLSNQLRNQSLLAALKCDDGLIARTRDDVRNALCAGLLGYEATEWVYGPKAFGLKLVAWMARKFDRVTAATLIVMFLGLRATSNNLLPSSEISNLAAIAGNAAAYSRRVKWLRENDGRFATVLRPKRLRRGFKDTISRARLLREIEAARMT